MRLAAPPGLPIMIPVMEREVLLRAEGLYRWYGERCAVAGLDLELARGDVLGLLGPNGAGKTTTLHMLTGNLAPSAGRVTVAGHDLLDAPRAAKAAVGYLPEQPPLYRELTVGEYLRYCARLNGIARARVGEAVRRAMARCGLEGMGRRLIGNLSKGYQQRVGIAQAIIHAPPVVILDEPTVGLDPIQIREIRELVRELGRDHAVILSTHILPEVQMVCSRVEIIHRGRIVWSAAMDALERELAAGALLVRLARPPAPEALAGIPGVEAVEPLGEGRFRLRHAAGASPAEAVAEAAVRGGWGLLELTPERRSLEQVFVELTTAEEPDARREAA